MGFVDLHVHSNASDGTFSPSQVVELAKNAGLDAFFSLFLITACSIAYFI